MKIWADFYSYYLQDLPGCTSFAAVKELRRAAQEFCQRTKVWRVDLDPVLTNATDDTYDFEIDSDQLIVKVMSAKLDEQDLDIILPGDEITLDGTASMLVLDQSQFTLMLQPDAGQYVYVKAAIKPSNSATGVSDVIFDNYAEAIACGAKARLMMKENKPYSSATLAQTNLNLFEAAIARANHQAAKGYSSAPLRSVARFI